MRGFPFLNLLIALLLSGAVLLPLVWRSTRATASSSSVSAESVTTTPSNTVPSHISLRFVHAPSKVRLSSGETLLHEWPAPNASVLLEDTIPLPLSENRAEFSLQIEWPPNTTDPTNAVITVEPEKHESRKEILWSTAGAVDEIVTLSWKP